MTEIITGHDAWSIIWNVVGGAIVAAGTLLIGWLLRTCRRRKFRRVFGEDSIKEMYLKYCAYEPPSRDTLFRKQTPRVPRETPNATNLTMVASGASARGLAYIANAIGINVSAPPIIEPDDLADERMDLSFIALGGTNHRAYDLLNDPNNVFLIFGDETIEARQSGHCFVRATNIAEGVDYGFIIKIHPQHNLSRTWICCAGFGEWGTSGAAWYLAHRWKDLYKFAKDKAFACITKTRLYSSALRKRAGRIKLEKPVPIG